MNKLLEFGRRTIFLVRVLSGYEERCIRTMRIQMENQIKQAAEKNAALGRAREQIVLQEVRRVVEEMQKLNKELEEAEASIEACFNPLDSQVQGLINAQLEGEENRMMMMKRAMQERASLYQDEAMRNSKAHNVEDTRATNQESESSAPQQQGNAR